MPTHLNDPGQLQEKMSELRGQISKESERVAEQTRKALDWKYQVAAHPIAATAIAAAVGYWLIPKKRSSVVEKSLEEMRALVEQQTATPKAALGLGQTLAMTVGSMLLRSVANGALNRVMAAWSPATAGGHAASAVTGTNGQSPSDWSNGHES
ncbi:MAG: hypothetical protein ABL888_06415 [Pirellulaceae bacterium]